MPKMILKTRKQICFFFRFKIWT